MNTTLPLSTIIASSAAYLAPAPAQDCPATAARAELASHEDKADIVDTALAAGSFNTLAAAPYDDEQHGDQVRRDRVLACDTGREVRALRDLHKPEKGHTSQATGLISPER